MDPKEPHAKIFNISDDNHSSDLNENQSLIANEMEQIIGQDSTPSPSTHCVTTRISETESDEDPFGNADLSDDDPTYVVPARPLPRYIGETDNDSDDSLITPEDIGVNGNGIMRPEEPLPSTSRKPAVAKTSDHIVSVILVDLIDLVWSRVKPLTRWRTPNPSVWKKNIAKKRRAEGAVYITNKRLRAAKIPKPVDCSKCAFKCQDIFSEEDRVKICRGYWALNFVGKKNMILSLLTVQLPKRILVNRKRPRPYITKCHFHNNLQKKQVCQKFFCSTLCICSAVIRDAVKNRDETGLYSQDGDPRIPITPPNKTPDAKVREVTDHIASFPTMESHYVRKESKRQYLDSKLTIPKMHELYSKLHKDNDPVSEITYRRIFATNFNLSPFIPKKDQCLVCNKYNTANAQQKMELESSYTQHIERKLTCLAEKDKDTKRAETDKNFVTVTFDLQAILQLPCSLVGILYYVRKLTIYNLCIYENALPNNAYCFPWSEINGKKGGVEIGTILYHYLSKCIPPNVTEVSLFSDTCSGQNRNQYVAAILLWAVNTIDNINVIEHKFLESGHSHMEADSMHSSIEHAKKHTDVFSMNDWMNIFKNARAKGTYKVNGKKVKKDRYQVKEFKYDEFLDLKSLAQEMIKNKTMDTDNNKVNWLKIKKMRNVKGDENIYITYDMTDEYKILDTRMSTSASGKRTTRTTRRSNPNSVEPPYTPEALPTLKRVYGNPFNISQPKKKDLVSLCDKGVIPEEYQGWYRSLQCDGTIVDRVPDVALEETSSEED